MVLKIAMIDPSLFTWAYDRTLSEALIAKGHDLRFYTKHLAADEQAKGAPFLREVFYPGFQRRWVRTLPALLVLPFKGLSHGVSLLSLFLRLRRDPPDVIHFQWAPLPVVDRLLMRLFQRIAPVVLTVHDSSPFNNNPSSRLQAIGSIEILKHFDGLIVHTEAALASLEKKGIGANRLNRIAHGVLGKQMQVRPMIAKPAGAQVTLLLFGYLKHYKGADVLIEAIAQMPPHARSITHLHVVGKPLMDTQPLLERARQLGIEDRITWDLRFVGDEEIVDIFGNADVTVMPYREIDASGVLMVALSIGRPIVASRIGLFTELIENDRHGYLVPPEDPAALSVALARLVGDASQRIAMGQQVRDLGASVPGWDRIADSTVALYQRLIAARS